MCQYVICHIYVCYINIYELAAWWKTISFRHKSLCIIYHQNYISIDLIYGISSKWTVLAFPSYWARFRINFVSNQNASRLYSFRYCLSPFEFERNLCPQGSRLKLLRKPTHNREDRLPFNRNTANMASKRQNQNQKFM